MKKCYFIHGYGLNTNVKPIESSDNWNRFKIEYKEPGKSKVKQYIGTGDYLCSANIWASTTEEAIDMFNRKKLHLINLLKPEQNEGCKFTEEWY